MCSAKSGRSSLNALNQRCLSCNCSNCMSSCMKRICRKKRGNYRKGETAIRIPRQVMAAGKSNGICKRPEGSDESKE